MNYFAHHTSGKLTGKIWNLFTELADANERSLSKNVKPVSFSHTLEIVHAAMSGSINFDSFNLTAYEYKCDEYESIENFHRFKKELHIVDTYSNHDEEEKVRYGDISVRRLSMIDTNLEDCINMQAFNQCLAQLLGLRKKVVVKYGVDLVRALEQSMEGSMEALELVRDVMSKNEEIEEVVATLCDTAPREELMSRLRAVA